MSFYPKINMSLCYQGEEKDIMLRIENALSKNECVKIKRLDTNKIVFSMKNTNVPGYNSFLPIIELNISNKTEKELKILISSRLKISTRIMLTTLISVAIVFEIALFTMFLSGQEIAFALLFLPIFIALFAYLISYIGLKIFSKNFLSMLTNIIPSKEVTL